MVHFGSPTRLCFGGYALDLQRCALLRGDHEIRIRPKSFDGAIWLSTPAASCPRRSLSGQPGVRHS
jgi:hypothetical protein